MDVLSRQAATLGLFDDNHEFLSVSFCRNLGCKAFNHELRFIKFKLLHIQIPRQIVTFGVPPSQLVAKIHLPNNSSSAAISIGSIAVNKAG